MSDHEDHSAETARFQAFQDASDESPQPNNAFRLLTLAGGLVVFAVLVWLLLL